MLYSSDHEIVDWGTRPKWMNEWLWESWQKEKGYVKEWWCV